MIAKNLLFDPFKKKFYSAINFEKAKSNFKVAKLVFLIRLKKNVVDDNNEYMIFARKFANKKIRMHIKIRIKW